MTKLQELAQRLARRMPTNSSAAGIIESEISIGLEPLLEAGGDALTLLLMEGFDASDEAKHLAEQLTQWRKR